MPYVSVKWAGTPLSPSRREQLFAAVTSLMADVAGKRREVTAVSLEEFPPGHWAVAGSSLDRTSLPAAHVDIHITAGTNSAEEKATLVRATHDLLQSLTGGIQTASYVVIHQLAAEAWGYGGLTQAARKRSSHTL